MLYERVENLERLLKRCTTDHSTGILAIVEGAEYGWQEGSPYLDDFNESSSSGEEAADNQALEGRRIRRNISYWQQSHIAFFCDWSRRGYLQGLPELPFSVLLNSQKPTHIMPNTL